MLQHKSRPKYRSIATALGSKPSIDLKNSGIVRAHSLFFFRSLQNLQADMLLGELQIQTKIQEISILQAKINQIRFEQSQNSYSQNNTISPLSSNSAYSCHYQKCGRSFPTPASLKFHQQLVHCISDNFHPHIFKIQIMSDD